MRPACRLFRAGGAFGEASGNADAKYSIRTDAQGNPYVEIDEDILTGAPGSDTVKTVNKYLTTHEIDMGGWSVGVNATTRNEYQNSGYTKMIKSEVPLLFKDKKRMAKNIDEIVQTAAETINETPRHHRRDQFKSFNRGNIKLKIGNRIYLADVLTGINTNGKETLYDVVNLIPQTTKATLAETASQSMRASPDAKIASDNNVAQTQSDVKQRKYAITPDDHVGFF